MPSSQNPCPDTCTKLHFKENPKQLIHLLGIHKDQPTIIVHSQWLIYTLIYKSHIAQYCFTPLVMIMYPKIICGPKPVLISTKINANEKSGNQHRLSSVHMVGLERLLMRLVLIQKNDLIWIPRFTYLCSRSVVIHYSSCPPHGLNFNLFHFCSPCCLSPVFMSALLY
jgi:hypothetical protein